MRISQNVFAGTLNVPGSLDSQFLLSSFNCPNSIVQISPSQFIVSDSKNDSLRLLNVKSNQIQTIETSQLNKPKGLAMSNNDLFICDQNSSSVKMLNGTTGEVENFVGQISGFQDGQLAKARLDRPSGAAVSQFDNVLYIADQYNHCIRYIYRNEIKTLCGNTKPSYNDKIDEVNGISGFNSPTRAVMLKSGNLLIVDTGNNALRHVHVGAKLVTTIIGQNAQYYHCNCELQYNPNYDARSLDIQNHYHVHVSYNDRQSGIIDISKYFKRPTAACQLSNGQILCACAQGEVWLINNKYDDAVKLENVNLGQISDLKVDIENPQIVYAVDSTKHVIWQLKLEPEQETVMMTAKSFRPDLSYQNELLKRSQAAQSIIQNSLMSQTQVEQKTQPIQKSQKQVVDFDLFLSMLLDVEPGTYPEDPSVLLELSPDTQQTLIKLILSLKSPRALPASVSVMNHYFALKILNGYQFLLAPLSKNQILQGLSMSGFIATALTISDSDELSLFRANGVEFKGDFCETLKVRFQIVFGEWLGGPYNKLKLVLKNKQREVVFETSTFKELKAEFASKRFESEKLIQCEAKIDVLPTELMNIGEYEYKGGFELEIVDCHGNKEIMWSGGNYDIEFNVKFGTETGGKKGMRDVVAFYCLG
ncbi:NHL_repeat-containing protein [Hexamita inflata]|uniref:NHL repeat-containing protein n=1 Tax=Hexamita inflata TaxID=28002 RepID=A0AA86QGT4_9EUKA|nr:NHL repeat-containing protein [Hexamita inflata]